MNEINLVTVRHADGREIQYVQFDKLAIGQILNERRDSEIHYAFQTHPDTRTEYIKLDALLRELEFVEVARTQMPFALGENFNELHFCVHEICTAGNYTAYEFENIIIIAGEGEMRVFTNCRINEAVSEYFEEDCDLEEDFSIDIPDDAAATFAFRLVNAEYNFSDEIRAPGEMLDDDNHGDRLQNVADIYDASKNGKLMRYITSTIDSISSFADDLSLEKEIAMAMRELETLKSDYLRFIDEQH